MQAPKPKVRHIPLNCPCLNEYGVEKEVTMKTYVAPVLELVALETEDVVMISGIKTQPTGELESLAWGSQG